MRYATIGTSWITDSFIEGAEIAGDMQLCAVYSRSLNKGQNFACKYGDIPVYTDIEKLAKCADIDAVYIASPNALHYSQSKLFLQHGKHVLCEKPATVTSAQLRDLISLAQKNNLVYMEAIMMRHLPSRTLIHQAIKQIGRISVARFDFCQLSSKYSLLLDGELPNIFNPRMAAGCLMDLGIYCVYAAIDFFGRPKNITAGAGFLDSGADGCGFAVFDYGDMHASLTYSKTGQGYIGSEIIGDKGTITIQSISKLTGVTLRNCKDDKTIITQDIPKAQLMSGEAAAFRRFAANREDCKHEIQSVSRLALEVCETMEEIRRQAGIKF
ncbi:MAG: Gfo/Idh/MocA family oxidoreductase [Oscillospiraceae bacterium]|nr:Gfo/Idh/MocA family oxidoreductase [Oscillospiraceae bacterium]